MFDLSFSYNWNNKLDNNAFTTIRIYNPQKHLLLSSVRIIVKGEFKGVGIIKEVKRLHLHQINEFIARIDTGYSKEECINIIRRMYPNVDFEKVELALILVVKGKVKE